MNEDDKKRKEQDPEKLDEFYPVYPAGEDIYNHQRKVSDIDNEDEDIVSIRGNKGDELEGLDVPGAGDDDSDEAIGEEDEENNYYSIGGDNHDNLEEDIDELEQHGEDA
jgi:hypothetical protein